MHSWRGTKIRGKQKKNYKNTSYIAYLHLYTANERIWCAYMHHMKKDKKAPFT
jgi:hypothetical protein